MGLVNGGLLYMNNILLKFKYNNKDYFIEEKNNNLMFYYVINNKRVYDLDSKEIDLLKYIINSIIPSNNNLYLYTLVFNKNKYNVFYDINTRLKLINSNVIDVNYYNLLYLLNNQDGILYNSELGINNEKESFVKRIIRYGKETIIILLSYSLLIGGGYLFTNNYIKPNFYEKVYVAIDKSSRKDNSEIDVRIRNAIRNL